MKLVEINPWQDLFKRKGFADVGIIMEAEQVPSRHMLKALSGFIPILWNKGRHFEEIYDLLSYDPFRVIRNP